MFDNEGSSESKNRNASQGKSRSSVVFPAVILISAVLLQLIYSEKDSISGVFIAYLSNTYGLSEVFSTTLVSCHAGIAYIGAFPSGLLLNRLGVTRMLMLGSLLTCAGFISSAFLPNFPALIFTYGLVSGFGLSALIVVTTYLIQQHFESRRAVAQSLCSAGQAFGQFMWPPLIEWLITLYGWRGAFLITAGIHLQTCIIAMVLKITLLEKKICSIEAKYIKQSKPGVDNCALEISSEQCDTREHASIPSVADNKSISDKTGTQSNVQSQESTDDSSSATDHLSECQKLKHLLTNKFFLLYCFAYFCCVFGHGVPLLWLPTLGIATGASAQDSAFLVSINGISTGIFSIIWGFISDFQPIKKYRSIIMCCSIVLAGAVSMVLVVMTTYNLLVLYAVLQGIICAYYYGLCYTVCVDFTGKDYITLSTPLFICTFGIGVLVSSPFAGWLVEVSGGTDLAVLVCGGIQLVGGAQLLVADIWRLKKTRNLTYLPVRFAP